ncbi:MAG: succinate dehydrogenase, cytochrome b556 subunit [Rhodospirillaceae bacterium]|jgi:succinate dehydrogenase / fumarate reductase cytochrome b subunit|nr:succinate dehydrogenase, cytochrome b556 subunit [Rhodospirillaceae bacterium]
MATQNRPLSPHLQVYRLPLTALMSITHRITGVGLTFGTLLLAWWVTAASYGKPEFEQVQAFLGSWIGLTLLLGFSFALFFHLCNGLRHLFWDFGRYFELHETRRADVFVLIGAAALTAATWVMVW